MSKQAHMTRAAHYRAAELMAEMAMNPKNSAEEVSAFAAAGQLHATLALAAPDVSQED